MKALKNRSLSVLNFQAAGFLEKPYVCGSVYGRGASMVSGDWDKDWSSCRRMMDAIYYTALKG